jgi:hypothetical protein
MSAASEIPDFAVADPILRHLFPIQPQAASLGKWQRTFDYDVWTHCHTADVDPFTLWERVPGGVIRIPRLDTVMHVIKAGTAHHIEGLFGYWRTSGSDIVWFRVVRDGLVHEAMVLGGCPGAYENDSISWICPGCAKEFGAVTIDTGRKRLHRFWAEEPEIVEKFNSSEQARTCPDCARIHPPAYRFRRHDAPETLTDLAW